MLDFNSARFLWKHVQCEKGNWHNIFCVGQLINLPFQCRGVCLERTETNEQIAEEFQRLHKEEIEKKSHSESSEKQTEEQSSSDQA